MGLLRRLSTLVQTEAARGHPSQREATLTERDEDGTVVVELADGTTAFFDEDEWVAGEGRVWVASVSHDSFHPGNRLQNPPVTVHIPVETTTAIDNRWDKSEADARIAYSVVRYSKIINPSDNPDERIDLNVPYLELHYEDG